MAGSLSCRLSLYADDSALIASGKSARELSEFLSLELESCRKWMIDNELSLHVGKTETIIFGSSKRLNGVDEFSIKCDDTVVNRVDCVKYLGIFLDQRLTGESHALKAIKKISARISFLYRKSTLLDLKTRTTLCLALIQPHFDYCCTAWHEGLSAKLKNRFDALQRKMVRFVFSMPPRGHVDQHHFRRLGWLTIRDRVRYFRLVHVHKIKNGLAPDYLTGGFTAVKEVHQHFTRGSVSDFHISSPCVSSLSQKTFGYVARKEWNSLPLDLKQIQSVSAFKSRLRSFLLSQYD